MVSTNPAADSTADAASTDSELLLVTLLDVVKWADADQIAQKDDECLESGRSLIENLVSVLKRFDKAEYFNGNLPHPVTVIWLEQVADKITTVLNMRYGCND